MLNKRGRIIFLVFILFVVLFYLVPTIGADGNFSIQIQDKAGRKIGSYKLVGTSLESYDLLISDVKEGIRSYSKAKGGLAAFIDSFFEIFSFTGYAISDLGKDQGISLVEIKNIRGLSRINVKIDYLPGMNTKVFAVKEQNLNFDEAVVKLPKTGDVDFVVKCNDFDFDNFRCANWKRADISFEDKGDHIVFNAYGFSAYAGIGTINETAVVRNFASGAVNPGNTLTVTLDVLIKGGEKYYAIDERIPAGFTVVDNGGGDQSEAGSLKWVVIQDAAEITYAYTLKAPIQEGGYTFSGTYMFEGDNESKGILGNSLVNVTSISECVDGDGDNYGVGGNRLACTYLDLDCNDSNADINPGAIDFCNNIDDDCDGTIDEGLLRLCSDFHYGVCAGGEESCLGGVWVGCPLPEQEICGNDIDENCNGIAEPCILCSDQGGFTCIGGEYCPGLSLVASDTTRCCSEQCQIPIWNTCAECGTGLFNVCDKTECYNISEGCYYSSLEIQKCKGCLGITCSDYADEQSCSDDNCGIGGCFWNQTECIRLESSIVVRQFSSMEIYAGENLTVTLEVLTRGGDSYYAIDERIPVGFTIIDNGGGDQSEAGSLKWAVIENAEDTTYTYTVRADQEGSHILSGAYMFEGDTEPASILGQALVNVLSSEIPDETPPVRSNPQPVGLLTSGTSSATISLDTDEEAVCRYSTIPDTSYETMLFTFADTGSMNHLDLVEGLVDGESYSYFVRCNDSSGNYNINDLVISFGVSLTGLQDAIPPSISFGPLTPLDGTLQSEDHAEIEVMVTEENLDSFEFNWDGMNYSLYDDSLVLMMNFDNAASLGEGSSIVKDVSGYGNDGSVEGAVWTSSGNYGGAFEFGGNDDYIQIDDTSGSIFDFTGSNTMSIWFNPRSEQTGKFMLAKFDPGDASNYNWGMYITSGSNKTSCYYRFTNEAVKTSTYDHGEPLKGWHHMACTYNGTSVNQYFDGRQVSNISVSDDVVIDNDPVIIGKWINTFDGIIDEARIWNKSSNVAEIQQLYFSNLRKYDIDKWSLYVNQSRSPTEGLIDKEYSYFASAGDSSGNTNKTETRMLTVSSIVPLCSEQEGFICAADEYCPGTSIAAEDTTRCCSEACLVPSWPSCGECGTGIFNICDRTECYTAMEGCYYAPYGVGGVCLGCAGATCYNYTDEQSCIDDSCDIRGCVWQGSSCGWVEPSFVTRQFSSATVNANSTLTITLDVSVTVDNYYAIDERIPAGFTVIDNGGGNQSEAGSLKWVVIENAEDTTYTYTLRAEQEGE
ncbi:hypothetical protein KY358_02445, partial [Candidatus Woesearchaeota archaeon]|nr:hypothetical protein [Candidatus Woesearchaeota archaeon]